jgi:hypothetical protein
LWATPQLSDATLGNPPYIDLKIVLPRDANQKVVLFIDAVLVKDITTRSRKLSIVLVRFPRHIMELGSSNISQRETSNISGYWVISPLGIL